MKKIIATAAFAVLLSLTAFAQIPIKGTWNMSMKVPGAALSQDFIIDDDTQGEVTVKMNIELKLSIMGFKANGTATISISGDFTAEGDKMLVKWKQESLTSSRTPVEVTYKGEIEEDTKDFEDSLTEIIEETEKEFKSWDETEFYNIKVKGDTLYMTSKDEKGKPDTDKLKRVK